MAQRRARFFDPPFIVQLCFHTPTPEMTRIAARLGHCCSGGGRPREFASGLSQRRSYAFSARCDECPPSGNAQTRHTRSALKFQMTEWRCCQSGARYGDRALWLAVGKKVVEGHRWQTCMVFRSYAACMRLTEGLDAVRAPNRIKPLPD